MYIFEKACFHNGTRKYKLHGERFLRLPYGTNNSLSEDKLILKGNDPCEHCT